MSAVSTIPALHETVSFCTISHGTHLLFSRLSLLNVVVMSKTFPISHILQTVVYYAAFRMIKSAGKTNLPLRDDIAKRVLSLSRSCLLSDNSVVRFVSRYSVWCGPMSSPFGSNVFHCCQRYCVDIDDVWSVTPAYIFSCCRTTDIESVSKVQMIVELFFIRDGYFTFDNFSFFYHLWCD